MARCGDCNYGTLIIGGGPAGLGLLVCAAQRSALPALLSTGVAVCEAGGRVGRGNLGNWSINSNSLAGAFCECIEGGGDDNPLRSLSASKEYNRLTSGTTRDSTAPLVAIADLNEKVGELLAIQLMNHPACDVFTHTKVVGVQLTASGCCKVTTERSRGGSVLRSELHACRVVMATGGYQAVPLDAVIGSLPLRRWSSKVLTAANAMKHGGLEVLASRFCSSSSEGQHNIVIIGASHSAWSVAWLLLQHGVEQGLRLGPNSITMVYRGDLKLYFASESEAKAANFNFGPDDVCQVTGRVHRLGGLRGDSLRLARQYIAGSAPAALRLCQIGTVEESQVEAAFDKANCIIPAFGFRPNLLPITDAAGEPVELATDSTKQLAVTADGHPTVAPAQAAIPQLFAYGLGAGLPVSRGTGGEASFRGRTDGVWLYQNDVGVIILRQLVPDASVVKRIGFDLEPEPVAHNAKAAHSTAEDIEESKTRNKVWHSIYTRKARTDADETPLHCLNGYEMIDVPTWYSLVRSLMKPMAIRSGSHVFEAGCGAGAFLDVIRETYGSTISGIDFCQGLVDVARTRVEGTFHWGDVTKIDETPFADSEFDYIVCFGVFLYLNCEEAAKTAIRQMLARCKPGGKVFIGEVSDLAKKSLAQRLRGVTHEHEKEGANSPAMADHLYVPKSAFLDVASEFGIPHSAVEIHDHDEMGIAYPTAPYRYSVYFSMPAVESS